MSVVLHHREHAHEQAEDDPSFVLEQAGQARAITRQGATVAERRSDWSDQPEMQDNVPLRNVKKVIVPVHKSYDMSALVKNRGWNNMSGWNYWNCGRNQMKGSNNYGVTQLPVPQYSNPANVAYLNQNSYAISRDTLLYGRHQDREVKLEVLSGMNLAGGNHPSGDHVNDPTHTTNKKVQHIFPAERNPNPRQVG